MDPRRLTGCVVYLSIRYSNHARKGFGGFPSPGILAWASSKNGNAGTIEYDILVASGVDQEVVFEPVRDVTEYDTTRRLVTRRGIKIMVLREGSIGRFSWFELLVKTAGGMAMLAMAATMVEMTMLHCSSRKDEFREYKVIKSVESVKFVP